MRRIPNFHIELVLNLLFCSIYKVTKVRSLNLVRGRRGMIGKLKRGAPIRLGSQSISPTPLNEYNPNPNSNFLLDVRIAM